MNAVSIPGSEELEVLSPSCIEIVQYRVISLNNSTFTGICIGLLDYLHWPLGLHRLASWITWIGLLDNMDSPPGLPGLAFWITWIGLHVQSISPTPCDYLLWGTWKYTAFQTNLATLHKLKDCLHGNYRTRQKR
ncbi:hypothetical protein AVEN_118225-1 [Araneus ventricosus]|uniref:Uncharacterized protein n=1 Tax=Araneus ventricosus TaxID=182803 RepID=A0A4Y2JNK2_ARAVE|nr:hypothetical protein AVEN_118225-1 [Araneus ventricosus]